MDINDSYNQEDANQSAQQQNQEEEQYKEKYNNYLDGVKKVNDYNTKAFNKLFDILLK